MMRTKFVLLLIFCTTIFILEFMKMLNIEPRNIDEKSGQFSCVVEKWNLKNNDNITYHQMHREWVSQNMSRRDNILKSEVRLLSSFVYPDFISVVTTSQHSFGKTTFCRYFDCERKEITNSTFESFFFPMNVVSCPRRIGAKYISLSDGPVYEPPQPIPLIFRAFEAPLHEISVCVGALYGDEPKWLAIIEFVEHYKLMGIKNFYFTVFDIDDYSRRILDEYLRTGEIELTVVQTEYKRLDWQFSLLQINECHQRAKYHSKWVLNVDLDERLIMKNQTITKFIRDQPSNITEIAFSIQRVQKTGKLPEKYLNTSQTISEMEFLKYNTSASISWAAYKTMYRPERIPVMYYHWAYRRYPGDGVINTDPEIGYIRHYRTTKNSGIGRGWVKGFGNFSEVPPSENLRKKLVPEILKKVKYVYARRELSCDEISKLHYDEYKTWGETIFNCVV